EAVDGRFTPLIGLSGALGGGRSLRLAWGMHFSVICAEDMPLLDALKETPGRSQVSLTPSGGLTRSGRSGGAQKPMDASPDFGAEFAGFYRSVCRDWPRGTVPADFYRIPPSAAPALLLSGTLDPVTPPRHAARVAAALGAKARNVVVPNAGHGILGLGCTRDVVYRFIDAQDEAQALKVDASCLARLPRPPMFEPWRPVLQGDQS
ncbi:MAG TPA: alpha/beta hydrolase, partial [Methylibium sp.]